MNKHTFALFAAALLLGACHEEPAATAPMRTEASLFTVPQNQRGRLQVITAAVQPVTRKLHVPAAVAFDDLKTSTVMPLVSGKVEKVLVREGDHVKAGQPLLVIASPDSSDATANLARDKATLDVKQSVLRRDEDLYQHKAISLEELEQARLDVTTAKATLEDDQAHSRIFGSGATHAELKSPISGLVVSRQVSAGNAVQAGSTPCFVITDPTAVWVIAQVYQEDVPRVSVGDAADIHSPVLGAPLQGHVTYVGAAIDPDTLTIPVRIAVPNPDGLLKGGMYVDASITSGKPEQDLVVPTAAVLRDDDNLPFVYVEQAADAFARRHVELGDQVGDGFIIRSGLTPGEKVLASGALFVQFADNLER